MTGAFFAAALILTESQKGFGLDDFKLGLVLLVTNLAMFGVVGYWGYKIDRAEQRRHRELEKGVCKVEWACNFSRNKFMTTLLSLAEESLSTSEVAVSFSEQKTT